MSKTPTAFEPGTTVSIAGAATSASEAIPELASGKVASSLRLCVVGDNPGVVFVKLGDEDVEAANTDMPVRVGSDILLARSAGQTHIAVITDVADVDVYITSGRGGE